MNKIYVTGGNGFLGRHLIEELIKEFGRTTVVNIDLYRDPSVEVETIISDVRNKRKTKEIEFARDDIVIHLAARTLKGLPRRSQRSDFFDQANTFGTKNLIESMICSGATRLIFMSTDMVYGVPESNPIAEHHPRIPIGEYGLSKLAAEEYIMDRQLRGDVQSTIFRPRLILGSGRLGFFDKIFQLVERNLPIPIIGNGCNHFPYLSVSDLVKAVTKVIKQDCWNEVFNVSSEKSPPVHDVLSALIKHSNSRSWIIKLPSDLTKYLLESLDTISFSPLYPEQFHIADKDFVLDISNIKKALNWTPEINDLEMLISSYDQFKRDRYSDLH